MAKKTLCLLLCALCAALMCACSFVQSAMEEAGLDQDLREKIDTAWSEVAKDGINNVVDEIWREYGMGRSLEWPSSGSGSLLPKLRDGETLFSLQDEEGDHGSVCLTGVTEEKLNEYKSLLSERGFTETIAASSLSELYSCDGLLVGFAELKDELLLCYGNSVQELESAYEAAVKEFSALQTE